MIVLVEDFLKGVYGPVGKDKYVRRIPGRPRYAVLCHNPRYSDAKAKEMAQRPSVLKFSAVTKQAAAILKDEALKAEWQQRHLAAKREASRHQRPAGPNGKPAVPERLFDYIRHELYRL